MGHRIREAMRSGDLAPMGSDGGAVEVDETFIGHDKSKKPRGMKGVYQHCSKRHLHRYLSEFDFRYSARVALGVGDAERADRALRGIVGKRLTYRHS